MFLRIIIESIEQYPFCYDFQNLVKFPKNFFNLTMLNFKNYLKNLPQILEVSLRNVLFYTLKFYQICISPYLGHHCRFYPSCSEYCCLAIKKYGTIKGVFFGVKRILKCHPFNDGGVDFP